MLEGVVADVLARVLGQYVLGIDRDSVRVGVWSGRLELGRLALRAEALATLFESLGLDLPVVVSSGTLQSLSVDVPWKRLGSEPVKVSVDLEDVTVRYEDAASVPSAPFALHASLGALRACSTDSSWSDVFLQDPLSPVVHKRIALSKLSVAWVPLEASSSEVDDQDAGISEDMGHSLSSVAPTHPAPLSEDDERRTPTEPPRQYLVQPVSAEMRVAITKAWAVGRAVDVANEDSAGAPEGDRAKSGRTRQARVSLDVRCSSVGLTLAGEQYSTLLRAVLALSDLERRSPPRTPRERWAWAVERLLPRFRQRRTAAARFNEAGLRNWRLQRERYVDARVRLLHARRVANVEEDPVDRDIVERIEADVDARDIVFFRDLTDTAAATAAASATAAVEPIASATSRLWSVFSRSRSAAVDPVDPSAGVSAAADAGDGNDGLTLSAGVGVEARDEDASPSMANEHAPPIVMPEPPDGSVSRSTSAAALGDADTLSHDDPGDGDGAWNGGESMADEVVTPNLRVVFGLQRGSLRLQRYGAIPDPLADIIFRDLRVELETRPGAGLLLEALLGTFEVWDAQCNTKVVYPRVPWAPQGVAAEVDTVDAGRGDLSAQRPPTMRTADGRGVSPDRSVDDFDGPALEHHLMDSEAYGAVFVSDALQAIRGGLHPSELLATGWQQSTSPPSSVVGVTTGGGSGSAASSAYTSSSPARAEDLTDDDVKARPLRHIAAVRLSRDAGADANVLSDSTRLALELAVGGVEMLLSGGPEGALAGVATFFSPRHTSPSVMAFLSAAAAPRLAAIRMEVQRALLERSVPPRLDVVIRGPRLLVPGPAAADPAAVVDLGTFAMDTSPPAELPPLSLHAALSARSLSPATRSRRPLSASRFGAVAREAAQSEFDARDPLQKHSRPLHGNRGRSVDSDRLNGSGRVDVKAVEYTDYRVAVSDLGIFLVPSLLQLAHAQRLVRPFSVHLRLHVLHNASFVEATAAEGQRSTLARLRLRGRVPALRVYLSHGAYRQLLTIARGWKAVLASAAASPVDGVDEGGVSEDGLADSTTRDGRDPVMASAEANAVPERIQQLDVELTMGDASLELRERTGRRLITVEAAGSRLQAVRGRSGFSLRYALRSLTVTDGSRGGTAPFRRLVHAGVGNSHRGVSPPRSLPTFLGSPGASLVPTPVGGVTRSSSYNSLLGVEAGEAAASTSSLSGQAGVPADVATDTAGGVSGRLPPWPRGGLSSTLRSASGEALVGPVTEQDRDFIKVVYSLDASRREQSLKVRILSLHVVCVRETYLSVVKFFYLFDETPPSPASPGLPDAAGHSVEGGAQYSDPFAAVGTTTSAAARRLAAKAERGLERGAATLARRGRLRLDAKLDGVSVDLISAEGALASLDVFSFRAGLRLDPSGAVAARGALAGFTVRDLTAAFPGHSSTVVYERLSPHGDAAGRSSGEGGGDRDVPDGFVCDSVDPHDVAGDAEDAEDGFTLIVPPTAKGGDVWLRARMTNLRIVYLQRFVFIVNTYFAALREGLAPVLQMQGGLSEIFDSSEPAGGAVPEASDGGEATPLPGGVRAGALEDGARAHFDKPHPRKRERRRLRLHVVTKGVDIVIPRHSQNAHEAVRLIVGHSVVSNEEAASSGYRLGLKLTAKGVNLYVLYPSLCKSSTSASSSVEHLSSGHTDAEGGSSDIGEDLRPIIPGESVDGYKPFAADIYSEILVDWWRTGRVPRFTFDAQGIPVLVRMPSSPARAKRAPDNNGGDNEQSQDAGSLLPALRLRFSAPQGISANLCEAEYTILYLTVTENFLERPDIEFTDIVAGLRTPIFPYRSPIPPLSLSSAPVPPNYRILFTVPVLRSIISHGGDPTAESARLISSTLTDVAGRFDYGIDCRIIFELSADLAGVDDARVGAATKGSPRTVIMPMLAAPSDGRGTFGSRAAATQSSGSASSTADNIASQAKTVSVSYDRPFGYRSNIMVAVSELRVIVVPELFRDLGLLTPPGLPYLVSTAPPPKARFNGRHVILTLARPEVWLRADQGPADQRALVLRGDVVVAKLEWAPVTMLISVDVVARAIRIGLTNVGVPEQAVPSGPGPWSGSSSSYPLTAVVSPPAAFGHSRDNAGTSASSSILTERETPLLYPSDISVEFNVSHDTTSPPDTAATPKGLAAAEAASSQPGEALPTPTRSLTITAESLLCRLDVHDTPLLLAVFSCFGRMSPTLLKLRPAEVELREAARRRELAVGGDGHRTVRQSFHLASEDDGLHGADDYNDEVSSSSGSGGPENTVEDAVTPVPERLLSVFFSMPHARLLFTDETSGRYVPILEVRFRQTIANANVPWMASISSTIAVDLFSEARGVWEAGVEPFALHAAFSHGASGSRAVVVRVAGRLDVNVSPTTVHGAGRVATAITSAIQELCPVEPVSSSPSSTGSSPAPGILVPGMAAPSTPPGQLAASSHPPGAASRGGVPLVRSVSAGGGGLSSAASSLRRPSVAAFCIRNDTGRPLVIWLPYDSTRRSLGSGREREIDVPTDELLLRAAAVAGRFDDADRARREALRCILALPGFEPVDVSAADVGIRTITLFPEQAMSGQATSVVRAADDGVGAGLSPQAGPAATPIVVAWDVQMRDGVPIGTVRSVMRIINRTRTLLEVAIGAPPARSRYNYVQTHANEDAGDGGRPTDSRSGVGVLYSYEWSDPLLSVANQSGPSATTTSVDECVDVSLRAPLLVDNTLPRSVSYKLAPVSSSGRAGAAVAATASALVQPLRTEHIHAVGRDVSAFALALGYDNRPIAIALARGPAAAAREQHESSSGSSALHARSEWSQCASGYRLTLYSEFWVRNRSDTPVLLRERSSSNDIVGTGCTIALRPRPPGMLADSYVCFSSGWISLRRAEVAPAARGSGSTETFTSAGDPWVSVSEELSDVDKPVQLFLGRGASVSVDVRPAGGRFGRTLIVTVRNVAWLNNSTNSAIQWCQPTTLTSRGIALSSMVHTLAVGETHALHWDRKESHSASREICLRFVDSESGTSDWIWSRPIPVLAAKRGGGIAGDVAAKMYRPKRHEQYIARVCRSLLADGSPVVRVLREDRSSPPYRVVNACASRSIAFRQAGVNETHPWLVRPGKSTRYAWDDPHAPRKRRLLIVETIEHVVEGSSGSSVASSERFGRESKALAGSGSSGLQSRDVPSAGAKDQPPLTAADDRGRGGNVPRTKNRSRRSDDDSTRDVHRPKFELSIDMVTADAGELCRTPRTFDPPMCISVAVQGPTKVVTFSDGKPHAAIASSGDRGQDRRPSSLATTRSSASSVPYPAQVPVSVQRSRGEQLQVVGDAGIPTIDLASLLGDAPDTRDTSTSSEPMTYPLAPSTTAVEDGATSQPPLPDGVPPAFASRDADASSRSERAVASTDIEVWLEGVGISFVDDTPMEIAYLSATSLRVHIDTQPGSELAILQVADLQLDNQLPNAPWPVLLWAPPPAPASPFDSSSPVPGANVLPANAHKPVLHIALDRFVFAGDSAKAETVAGGQQRQQRVAMVKGAFAALQHLQLSLDEEFLLRAWMFMKSLKSVPGTEDDEDLSLEDGDHVGLSVPAVGADSLSGGAGGDGAMSWKRGPLYVECLLLCPIQLTVSLATARGTASFRGAGSGYRSMLRALLSAAGNVDRAELRFRALELHHALDTAPHFGHLVGEYYLAQLDAQKMALLSSSALVGNPSALFDSIAVGARDFFVEPARANGAADFIAGLGRGSSSLLTNTVGGLVGSLGGIPSAVALGLETAVGDRDYLAERESIRGRRGATSTPAQGLFTGALSFGHGLASGAAGLIREPVAGAMTGGPVGFLRGIGRGVVGGLVKPLAGALDLIGEPAAGFRAFISTERNRRAAEPVRPPRFFAPGPASRLVAFELRPALGDALLRALTREAVSEEESDAAEPGTTVGLSETVVEWIDLSGDEHSARGGVRERERLLEIWAVLRRCAFGGARDRGGGGGGAPSSLAAVAKTENEVLAAQWLAHHAHDRVALITSRRFLVGTLHGRTHFSRSLDGIVDAHVPAAAGADYVLLGVRPAGGDPSRPAAAEWQRLPCGSVASRNALHAAVRAATGADGGLDSALTPRSARRAATAARRRQRDGSMEMVSFGSGAASARRMPSL
ncbi:hypothetical protein I4F81_004420 [Pyropia yezoensis]|uniref:Uncharacterized protein n=1 Tax=Pyropia yezoensis TaxID=2788 RepID=A0ACC3BV62_PYRYE|nr:hypothetical protein I4F81_004420 [Neopyropia yezoensis]